MTLVIPRLLSAVAGFVEQHGILPTRVAVPLENWLAYRASADSVPAYNDDLTRALLAKVELVPLPLQVYIALDQAGRYCNYDDGGSSNWGGIESLLRGAESKTATLTTPPIPNSYLVPGTLLSAGEYPGSPPRVAPAAAEQKLSAFLDAGIRAFVDLTDPADRLAPYAPAVQALGAKRGYDVSYTRPTIRDMDVCDPAHMRAVLDAIDVRIEEGRGVYVHCWGGIGRTGMVVGCWLVRHGRSGDGALQEVNTLFRTMSATKVQRHDPWGSPQTEAQRSMVRGWADHDHSAASDTPEMDEDLDLDAIIMSLEAEPYRPPTESVEAAWTMQSPHADATPPLRDRMRGALVGLAVGDAVGTTVEFRQRGSFPPVTDMIGGGPFRLAAGQWTDDTSMALCLAESLGAQRQFDARDQMERYVRWWRQGHLSSTGSCFDIGNTIGVALRAFEATDEPFSGPTGEWTAGNGSLMRLAPVPMFFFGRPDDAIALAGESSRTTNGAPVAVDACRYLSALLIGAFRGATRAELLASRYEPEPGYWDAHPLHPVIAAIADGSFRTKPAAEIRGTGYAADALEAALWAFHSSSDFREGCLLAVNLGDDADTTAAIFGQLAGAFYGESGIPIEWRAKLAHSALISRHAESLFQLAFGGPPCMGPRGAKARAEAERLIAEGGGDPSAALSGLLETEERDKREMGAFAYHMSGPANAQAMREEIQLQLRIAIGMATAQHQS